MLEYSRGIFIKSNRQTVSKYYSVYFIYRARDTCPHRRKKIRAKSQSSTELPSSPVCSQIRINNLGGIGGIIQKTIRQLNFINVLKPPAIR